MPDAQQFDRAAGDTAQHPHSEPHSRGIRRWGRLLREIGSEVMRDHATMTAGALAFYSLLGIVPVLVAVSAVYGLIADATVLNRSIDELRGFLPDQVRAVLMQSVAGNGAGLGLGLGLAVSLMIVLWTAQWAASGLITALNIAFDVTEGRGFWRRQAAALAVALAGIGLLVLALLVAAVLPAARSIFSYDLPNSVLLSIRWPLLALLSAAGLTALYRWAPSGRPARRNWLSWGALSATLLWIGASAAFSLYLRNAGSFDRLYGSLGGIAIFVFWLYLTGLIILLGAEFDATLEARRQGRGESGAKRILREHEKNTGRPPTRADAPVR
jgi:membrane protein